MDKQRELSGVATPFANPAKCEFVHEEADPASCMLVGAVAIKLEGAPPVLQAAPIVVVVLPQVLVVVAPLVSACLRWMVV